LDWKGIKTKMSSKPDIVQYSDCGLRGRDGKSEKGGVKLEGGKIFSLAYADDIVLMVDKEEEMGNMIERLERYLEEKGLELKRRRK